VTALFERRGFRDLFIGQSISAFGDWMVTFAIMWLALKYSGSSTAVGGVLVLRLAPSVLAGSAVTRIVDRWDRRSTMVVADIGRGVAVALLLVAQTPDRVWIVYLALALESIGSLFFRPAIQAHTPLVVGTGTDLTAANALNALTDGVMRLVGGPLGAALMVALGFTALVWIDIASYLLSALTILLMARVVATAPKTAASARRLAADFFDGLRALRGQPIARALLPITVIFLASNASLSALLIPFGVVNWGGQQRVGFVVSALGAGFLLGAPLLRLMGDRVEPRYLLSATLMATAVGFFLLFTSHTVVPAMMSAVLIGTSGSMALVIPGITLQRVIANEVLGRVTAVFLGGEAIGTMIGAVAGPLVAEEASILTITLAACSAVVVGAALSLTILPRMGLHRPGDAAPLAEAAAPTEAAAPMASRP